MLQFIKKAIILILTILINIFPQLGPILGLPEPQANDFRVTSYIMARTVQDSSKLHAEDFDIITDVILFGPVSFNEDGSLTVNKQQLETALTNIRNAIGNRDVSVTVTALGPKYKGEYKDWDELMQKQAELHNNAFSSGKLETNILNLINQYNFDGVQFDYEFPITDKNWESFSKFLVSMDRALGKKSLGIALSHWDNKISPLAIACVDHFELMLYDIYDNNGVHSTFEKSVQCTEFLKNLGIPKNKVDFGIPFYGRPLGSGDSSRSYEECIKTIDQNGYSYDSATKETFCFNTPQTVAKKTLYAKNEGFSGVMIWHYTCDLPSSNPKSLLRAVNESLNKK